MPRQKKVKLTKKILDVCPHCGRPKAKDESIVTNDRMNFVNDVMIRLDEERTLRLS